MADNEQREAALRELTRLVQPYTVEPLLEKEELLEILDSPKVKRASTWSANRAVSVGEFLAPTVDNGYRYPVTKAGTTGSTEPTWAIPSTLSVRTTPDNTVTFGEGQHLPRSLYDMRQACYEAWDLRCTKSSHYMSAPGADMASIHERCKLMRDRYEAVLVG